MSADRSNRLRRVIDANLYMTLGTADAGCCSGSAPPGTALRAASLVAIGQ